MSLRMIEKVKRLPTSPTQKLVLFCLADCHNGETNRCDPTVSTIMQITGLSNRAIATALTDLEAAKHITVRRVHGGRSFYLMHPIQPEPVNEVHDLTTSEGDSPVNLLHQTSEPAAGGPVNLLPKPVNEVHANRKEPEEKPERTRKSAVSSPSFPEDLPDEYRQELQTWWQHKREKGQTYKPTGWATLVNQQRRKPIADLKRDIEHSLANNYAGIFAPRPDQMKPKFPPSCLGPSGPWPKNHSFV